MLNFALGPVMSSDLVLKIGSEQTPYFRTPEFSKITLENEKLMKEMLFADEDSKVIFLTGSGTSGMEATVMNVFTETDKVLVVNGGGFGQRFVDLCKLHNIDCDDIKIDFGSCLTSQMLEEYDDKGYTAFMVNICETSSGVHYDIDLISDFCRRNNLFLVVDAVSSFLADYINMSEHGVDVVITGSQKALACPPGIAIITLSGRAVDRVNNNSCKSMYFDLKDMIVYYFVTEKLSPEQILENCRKFDSKEEWTTRRSDDELLNHFKFYKDIEKKIIKDCKMYNIKCIDTSENRQILFNQLLDEVKCELNI